jgi:hypothetical protein
MKFREAQGKEGFPLNRRAEAKSVWRRSSHAAKALV